MELAGEKEIINSAVCGTGTGEGNFENEYCGIIREVIGVQYQGESLKKRIQFICDWV